MSKNPSPRLDQLRAMREAQFASAARSRGADKPSAAATPAAAPAPKTEKREAAGNTKKATARPAKAKKAKAKKAGR